MQGGQFSILTMIMQGWYATYPLLLISIVCVTIIIERIWTLWGVSARASSKAETLIGPLRQGKFNEALKQVENPRNPGERVFRDLIAEAGSSERERLQDVDEERRYAEQLQLRGLIWVLADRRCHAGPENQWPLTRLWAAAGCSGKSTSRR
jgi:hypothetical protein